MKRTNSFVLFGRAFKNAKNDFWVSIQVLFVATVILALLFYFVEHTAQPEEYKNPWDAFVWAITRYIGDPGKFAGKGPVTLTGRYIDTFIGILKILIFAVPAGLVANGFRKAMEDDKRKRQLTGFSERLRKAFRRKQCRYTRYKVVPRYVSIVDIEAAQRMTTKDILDTIDFCQDFRLRNLATTQNLNEHPQDRLVVEHFPLEGHTSYGCKIDRGSDITIVSTSSVSEAGIGNFSYYLALYGGFNYISKEFEQKPDDPLSYYLIGDEHAEPQLEDFLKDLRALTRGDNKWAMMMLSASGAEEPQHPTQFHFVHKVQKKLEAQPTTTIQEEKFNQMYQALSQMLDEDFQLKSDLDELYLPVGKKNIAMQIGGGKECNAFTLRTAFSVTEWDDRYIAIVRKMAEIINLQIGTGKAIEEDKAWKESAMGF
jgi:voltage-gated potassium channel